MINPRKLTQSNLQIDNEHELPDDLGKRRFIPDITGNIWPSTSELLSRLFVVVDGNDLFRTVPLPQGRRQFGPDLAGGPFDQDSFSSQYGVSSKTGR